MTITRETTVADRLRMARQLAQLDQSQVAAALGCARSSVSNWENGHANMLVIYFIGYAHLTGVSLEWLAFGVGPIEAAVVRPEGFEPPTF